MVLCRRASPSCLLASAQVASLPCRVMTADITFSTSGGGRPYDLISVMSFLFRDSRACEQKEEGFLGFAKQPSAGDEKSRRNGSALDFGLSQEFCSFLPTLAVSWATTLTCLHSLGGSDTQAVPPNSGPSPLGMFSLDNNVRLCSKTEFQSVRRQSCDIACLYQSLPRTHPAEIKGP